MTGFISKKAEEIFGIKADLSDVERLRKYVIEKYGSENPENIEKVFITGEAAGFLTVNETYFFREPLHFEFLLNLLDAFEETEMRPFGPRTEKKDFQVTVQPPDGIRICSAATSTGCEAYSIAMLLEAYNRGRTNPLRYHIDAFDINQGAIKTASEGVYGERSMREDGSSFRYMAAPYIKKLEQGYKVDDSLRKNITFFVHNLMDILYPNTYHIIFFRNAFIYFSQRTRPQVLYNLSCALKEKGILIMGVSETAGASHESLEEKNRRVYSTWPQNGTTARGELSPASARSAGSSMTSVSPLEVFYFQKSDHGMF